MIDAQLVSDVWCSLVLPLVALYSALSNALCVLVLVKLSPLMSIYKHMLVKCLAHLIYSLIGSLVFVAKCGHIDTASFAVQLYCVYVDELAGRSLLLFATFVETWIGLERLLLLRDLKPLACHYSSKLAYWTLAALAGLSLLVNLPATLVVSIKAKLVDTQTVYYEELAAMSFAAKLVLGVEMSARGWLMSVLIVLVAMLMCAALRKRDRVKRRMLPVRETANSTTQQHQQQQQTCLTSRVSVSLNSCQGVAVVGAARSATPLQHGPHNG